CLVAIAWFYPFQNTPQKEFVSITSKPLSNAFLSQNIPIIDIRTESEWRETGVIPQSHLITFYKEDQSYNEKEFLEALATVVKKDDTFVILCRSGNRSLKVTNFLFSKEYSHVINLSGGINEAMKNGVNTVAYQHP
ncbi:MAG: rhodanese-like domain-containing protein, partial [Erysipelotrichia bacterium]|nr:rhodanese-like domain-containing protein [Erysipelotrichia bacterium]